MNSNDITDGELFADLQVSMTEVFLIRLLDGSLADSYQNRLEGNILIIDAIKLVMKDRFSNDDIIQFLENGSPRKINLSGLFK